MSLGDNLQKYAAFQTPEMVHDGRDLTDPQILQVIEGTMYELEMINLSDIEIDPNSPDDYIKSGKDWDGYRGLNYQNLEEQITNSADVPPLVLKKLDSGKYKVMDGYHRSSIARHLGIEQFPAYTVAENLIINPELKQLENNVEKIAPETDLQKLEDILKSNHPLLDSVEVDELDL
jgi:hypothetical protein